MRYIILITNQAELGQDQLKLGLALDLFGILANKKWLAMAYLED